LINHAVIAMNLNRCLLLCRVTYTMGH